MRLSICLVFAFSIFSCKSNQSQTSGLRDTLAVEAVRYAGCKDADFVADTGGAVTLGIVGVEFSPRCLKIKTGAKLTVAADSFHPISAAADIGGAANPFKNKKQFSYELARVMSSAGSYGFFCNVHGDASGKDMAALVVVED